MRPHILRVLSFPAAAVALLALALPEAGSAGAAASPGWQPALPVAAGAPASSAPYYVWYGGPGGASVVKRLEERRGGKEGRSRGSPHHLKKKEPPGAWCCWARPGSARERRPNSSESGG